MEKIGLENCCGGGGGGCSVVVPGYLCGGFVLHDRFVYTEM